MTLIENGVHPIELIRILTVGLERTCDEGSWEGGGGGG